MKRIVLFVIVSVLLSVSAGCHREEPELNVSSGDIALSSDGGFASVSFTCNYKWTAQSSAPWVKISPSSGEKGSNTISVTVEKNDGTSARSASVNIQCDDISRTLRISQAQPFSQKISLIFTGHSAVAPSIFGNGLVGEIDWGDGVKESYKAGLGHSYSGSGSHTVTISLAGGSSFEIGSVTGITELDFSEF